MKYSIGASSELESLVVMFRYLSSAGFKMSFSLKSENGIVHISFDVNLCFYLRASGITLSGIAFKQRHRLPAYHHRIRRRKEVRLYSSHKNGVLGTTANDNYTHVN